MKIRSDLLRIHQSLHTWVGITTGALLFIGFFAGALTMFKQPLERWISAPAHMLPSVAPASRDKLVSELLLQHTAARHEFTLHLLPRENVTAPVVWSEGESHELQLSGERWQATLNQQGELQAEKITPDMFGELIDMLHRTAGIPGTLGGEYIGVYIMGIAGIMYFLALVSGLVLLLPTLVKDFLALRPGKNRKRFWLDAHNVIGIASLPYHIVISLTVIVFAFHDFFYDGLAEVVYREQPMFTPPAPKVQEPYQVQTLMPVSELIARVQQAAPQFVVDELLFMDLETVRPRVRVAINSAQYILQGPQSGYVIIHPYTGELLDTSMLPTQADAWSLTTTSFFALHFGTYGGNMMRWVYFFLGLGGAFLFYSGNLLWIESRRKKQKQGQAAVVQARNTRWMAAATIGICLGSIIGTLASLLAGKWLFTAADNINNAYLSVYYAAFLLAIGWAFYRGAAVASVHLLWLCAAASIAVPATSLLSVLLPSLRLWAHSSPAALGVDLTALAAALMFVYGARLTARRVNHGPRDSVWSARRLAHE
ncbi:MAG TPA: PepSY-associated TM helix domain-containing protein [Cellvibrio sp.]|nr:PepSY-associated TM helix domain-containing protein [Cellvibrio sp.]